MTEAIISTPHHGVDRFSVSGALRLATGEAVIRATLLVAALLRRVLPPLLGAAARRAVTGGLRTGKGQLGAQGLLGEVGGNASA